MRRAKPSQVEVAKSRVTKRARAVSGIRARGLGLALALGLALGLALPQPALADSSAPYTYHRDAKDPRWVQGEVTVDAPPDVVFATVEKVDAWPKTLTDISRLRVLSHRGDHWEVELETRTLPGGMLGYDVAVARANRQVKLYTQRLGVRAIAQTDVRPGPLPTQSIITYSLLLELSGLPSLLISDKTLREKQEHMVAVTLRDFHNAFAAGK